MLTEQLLHGLGTREMCDEIIARKPATFSETYEIANALEATRKTTKEVKDVSTSHPEATHKLGYGPPRMKNDKKPECQCSSFRGQNRQPSYHKPSKQQDTQGYSHSNLCSSCGGKHARNQCRFRDAECHS